MRNKTIMQIDKERERERKKHDEAQIKIASQ